MATFTHNYFTPSKGFLYRGTLKSNWRCGKSSRDLTGFGNVRKMSHSQKSSAETLEVAYLQGKGSVRFLGMPRVGWDTKDIKGQLKIMKEYKSPILQKLIGDPSHLNQRKSSGAFPEVYILEVKWINLETP